MNQNTQLTSLSAVSCLEFLSLTCALLKNESFNNLSNLKHLHLEKCQLCELRPDSFEQLPNLQVLRLIICKGYAHLNFRLLAKLKWLEIQYPESFDLLDQLAHIPCLEVLDLYECEYINRKLLTHLASNDCGNPRVLMIGCKYFDGEFLARMSNVEILKISYAQEFNFNYEFLANENSTRLRSIVIEQNNKFRNLDFCFSKLNHLESLDLSSCCRLNLNSNIFVGLRNLQVLLLSNVFRPENKDWLNGTLFRGLEQLRVLDLSDNCLCSISADVFANTPNLERLSLRRSQLGNIRNNPLRHLTKLNFLDLGDNQISILDRLLLPLHCLEYLRLDLNNLEKLDRMNFEGLCQLKQLDLSFNCIYRFDPYAFAVMPHLERVFLDVSNSKHREELSQIYGQRVTFSF